MSKIHYKKLSKLRKEGGMIFPIDIKEKVINLIIFLGKDHTLKQCSKIFKIGYPTFSKWNENPEKYYWITEEIFIIANEKNLFNKEVL